MFNYNVLKSNSTTVEDIAKVYEKGVMSIYSSVENNPYVSGASLEVKRISMDKDGEDIRHKGINNND